MNRPRALSGRLGRIEAATAQRESQRAEARLRAIIASLDPDDPGDCATLRHILARLHCAIRLLESRGVRG